MCVYSLLICSPLCSILTSSLSCSFWTPLLSSSETLASCCLIHSSCSLRTQTNCNAVQRSTSHHVSCGCTHRLMSRISSCSARSSSESSSSPAADEEEGEEASKRLWLPVSWFFALVESTRRLQRWGWCLFRRDNTDWTFARTEWLQPADWEGRGRASNKMNTHC